MGYRERKERTGSGRQRGAGDYYAGTALKPGATDLSYLGPDVLDYIEGMARIGYDSAISMEILEYQASRDDADRQYDYYAADLAAQTAENTARIAAGKYTEAASIGAEADMYAADQALRAAQEHAAAARYAADQALEAVRIQEANRLKIAAAELKLESQRVASEELGAPSDWRKQVGFLRGMGMTQADIAPSAIQQTGEMLGPVDPGMYQAAPQAQQAIVGEAGPELATATPQGVEVQPIQRESAWWLRKQGVPGMQWGGRIGGGYTADRPAGGRLTRPSYYPAAPVRRTQTEMMLPGWQRQAAESRARMGQARAAGGAAGAGGEGPVISIHQPLPTGGADGTAPIAGDGTTTGEPPYLEMLRSGAYVPLWEAWGGPRTKPEVGMDIPILMPHEINYGNFLRLTPTEQQMAFADWEALGMAPDTAFMIMQRSAMRGTGRAVTAYG